MTVDPTDKFLVNRSGSSYHLEAQNLMAQLEDDDLLLVNRNSKSYKITGAEFKDSLSSPPIIQSVTLTEDDPAGARFTSQDFTTTAVMLDNGTPASTKSIRGWVEGSLTEKIETDTITAVDIPATPTSYSVRPHNVQSALLSGPTVPFNSADAFLETGIPLGTPPSVAISTHWLLFDLGVAATVTIGRESAGASASTAVLWGTNDPNASWTYVATGEYTDMREVSGSGYRFYAYGRIDADNIDGTTQTQTSASAVYFVTAASGGFPTLTFASDKDLAKLQPRDEINQEDSAASGTVGSVNVAGNSLTLSSSDGTWGPANANPGHYAIGPSTIVDNSKKYLNLDASLNVIGLTDDDTYTRSPANTTTPKISFPATLDNGEVPDAALPPGTSIQTEFKAENTALPAGTSMVSNVVTPSPSCVSGPIETDVIIDVDLNATGPVYSTNNDGAAMDSPWSNAFDGDTSTFAETFPAIQSTLTFSPAVDFSKLEIYAAKTSGHVGLTINENVVPDLTATNPSTAIWQNITSQVTSPLRSLELSRGQGPGGPNKGGILMAVRVDDKILIDGESQTALTFASDKNLAKLQPGDYIEQENASGSPVYSSMVDPIFANPSPAFDGLTGTEAAGGDNEEFIFAPENGISGSQIRVHANLVENGYDMTLNDGSVIKVPLLTSGGPATPTWSQAYTIPGGRLTKFQWQRSDARATGIRAIEIDGTILEDGTGRGPSGTVGSVNVAGNSLTLASSNGTWGPANQDHYAIGPDYTCPPITLDADDPDDVETFYAIKAALVQYESERIEFRELLITALTDAGFTAQQIASVMRE